VTRRRMFSESRLARLIGTGHSRGRGCKLASMAEFQLILEIVRISWCLGAGNLAYL
jgi:hypothetical protein